MRMGYSSKVSIELSHFAQSRFSRLRFFISISRYFDFHHRFQSRVENSMEIPVYNYIHDDNNLTWGKYMETVKNGLEQPFDKAIW